MPYRFFSSLGESNNELLPYLLQPLISSNYCILMITIRADSLPKTDHVLFTGASFNYSSVGVNRFIE